MRKIQGYECYSEVCLESDLVLVVGDRMAEDGSRTSSVNEAGSSSKDVVQQAADDDSRDEKWLQLGLGSSVTGSDQLKLNQTVMEPLMTRRSSGLVELDLLSGTSTTGTGTQDMKPLLTPPMFHMTSEFRPTHPPPPSINTQHTVASSSSVPLGSYFSRSFQHPNIDMGAGPSSDDMMMKVVDAPPRPHSGIWFVLQASQNQSKEPFLPQIPKSYLRIK
ncbi:hypothetical protein BVC80_1837g209 [Macleaya cordata]|uniref:Uncharacterized protein n=1 Tax=Macleaya cordata TaxID=56857 RepID=A0A200R3U6_MACCD|nr:hypothetical protein BVC80_1837g209 [Macleaya cordata]